MTDIPLCGECFQVMKQKPVCDNCTKDRIAELEEQVEEITNAANFIADQQGALFDAVMELNPFRIDFDSSGWYDGPLCAHCGDDSIKHDNDCPITKLREVLKDQGAKDAKAEETE